VTIPDLNQVLIHIKSGKLFPFGFLKLLWYRRKIPNARVLILGILSEFRNKGIDVVLYKKIQENLATLGIYHAEACYIMADNLKMLSILEKIGGRKVKDYRIYRFDVQA
jgi:ribosomal protein S18 acetylase RimI-like enzyme